ncbi:MAG TPA: RHS repeat-associated core domain-containing protein [Pseudobacteroides sp.]|nr:RHS repeat-associated core domain-containing protein [Pseudobacteroides sp.]
MRTAEGGYIRNRYDPEGLRYELYENGKVSRFIFSGREVVTEVDDNYGLKAAIIRGHEILAQKDSKDSSYYYFNNAHGDVTALLDGRGEIVNRYKYDAFGNTIEAVEKVHNRFRYAGEQFDPVTGQYYLRARFYNPVIGRFTQEDTYRGDGLNLYAYVQNNPVKYVDPSGYCGESKSNPYNQNSRDLNDDIENLKSKTHSELDRLLDLKYKSKITNDEMGPAVAGILDTKTGKVFLAINDPNGYLPDDMHKFIKTRVEKMPQAVKNSYTYTKGAGSHAEVLALNNALLERPDAKLSDFIGYVLTTKKLGKKYPSAGLPFERCKHCSFITKGVRFISEE